MGFKANRLGLRGFWVDVVQGDHETELVSDLARVDGWFFPAILTTPGKWMSAMVRTFPSPGRWPRTTRTGLIDGQERAPLVQQTQSWRKRGFLWSRAFGRRGCVIFRRISCISRFYDSFPRRHRDEEARDLTAGRIPELNAVFDTGKSGSMAGMDYRQIGSRPACALSLSPSYKCFPPTVCPPLELPASALSLAPASPISVVVALLFRRPLAPICPVCSVNHVIETSRCGLRTDQDPRSNSKGCGFQYHISRCLACRVHRLLPGMWHTLH